MRSESNKTLINRFNLYIDAEWAGDREPITVQARLKAPGLFDRTVVFLSDVYARDVYARYRGY